MTQNREFQMRVSEDWLAMVDEARGVLTRSAFVKMVVSDTCGSLLAASSREARRGAVPVVRTFHPEPPPAPVVEDDVPDEIPLPKIARRKW